MTDVTMCVSVWVSGRKSLGCESSSSQSWSFQRLFQLSGDYPGVHPTETRWDTPSSSSSYFCFIPKNWELADIFWGFALQVGLW